MSVNGKTVMLFLALCLFGSLATAQPVLPEYRIVLDTFFSRYNEGSTSAFRQMHFEKRPQGYWISWIMKGTSQVDDTMPFWKDGNFQDLPFQRLPVGMAPERVPSYAYYQDSRNAWLYDWLPFYGYPGYFEDIIARFQDLPSPTDTQLFALAHAWSASASNAALGWSEFAAPELKFDAGKTGSRTDAEMQTAEYQQIRRKAWSYYEQLLKRAPVLVTPEGPVHHLYSDDVMVGFLELLILEGESDAMAILKNGLYDEFLLQGARNLLDQAPSNCLLLSQDHSTTFQLLYTQAREGFRQDVRVLDVEFMNHPEYLDLIRHQLFKAKGLSLSISREFLSSPESTLFLMPRDSRVEALPLDSFLERIHTDPSRLFIGPWSYLSIPSDGITLRLLPELLVSQGLVSKKQAEDLPELLESDLGRFGESIPRSTLALLDLISTTDWQPPMCIILPASGSPVFPIGYEWRHGLLARHSPIAPPRRHEQYLPIPTLFAESSLRLLNKLKLLGQPRSEPAHYRLWNTYLSAFLSTSEAFLERKESEKAVEVATTFIHSFPELIPELRASLLPFVRVYLEAGREDKAIELAHLLLAPLESLPEHGTSEEKTLQWLLTAGKQYGAANLIGLVNEFRARLLRVP